MKQGSFWGRLREVAELQQWDGQQSQLSVIYGRRRVGKTRLVERACQTLPMLHAEGLEGERQSVQRQVLLEAVSQFADRTELSLFRSSSWRELFSLASRVLGDRPCILFLDEFQWMAGSRTTLVSHLKYAWDNLFSKCNRVHLILCGSVSSFMVNKVLQSKALYGRVDREIHLLPLRLPEVKPHFTKRRSLREVAELYMVLGGIPEYLKRINRSKSARLNLQALCFTPNGYLVNEFDRLFASHFGKNRHYRDILIALAKNRWADREHLQHLCNIDSGGRMSEYLRNLELAGFVESYASD